MVVMLFTVATRTCRGFLVPYPGQRAGVLNRAAGASLMRRYVLAAVGWLGRGEGEDHPLVAMIYRIKIPHPSFINERWHS